MSNQIYANKTEKFIQGRQYSGTFTAGTVLTSVLTALPLQPPAIRDLPITESGDTITFNDDMTLLVSGWVNMSPGDAVGNLEQVVLNLNGGRVSDAAIGMPASTAALQVNTIIVVAPGDTAQVLASNNSTGGVVQSSNIKFTRIF